MGVVLSGRAGAEVIRGRGRSRGRSKARRALQRGPVMSGPPLRGVARDADPRHVDPDRRQDPDGAGAAGEPLVHGPAAPTRRRYAGAPIAISAGPRGNSPHRRGRGHVGEILTSGARPVRTDSRRTAWYLGSGPRRFATQRTCVPQRPTSASDRDTRRPASGGDSSRYRAGPGRHGSCHANEYLPCEPWTVP
jgi:hypothetical protein